MIQVDQSKKVQMISVEFRLFLNTGSVNGEQGKKRSDYGKLLELTEREVME